MTEGTLGEARRCVFCGAPGPLTKEHVFPQWIWREYGDGPVPNPVVAPGPYRRQESVDFSSTTGQPERSFTEFGDRPILHATGIVVRAVCGSCNNGWMSDLETKMAAVVRRIIGQDRWRASRDDVQVIRRWSAKTGLMLECADPTMALAKPDAFKAVYENLDLPGTWHFGLARVSMDEAFQAYLCPYGLSEHFRSRDGSGDPEAWDSVSTERVVFANQYLLTVGPLMVIARHTPFQFRPPSRIDHDLFEHVRGEPWVINERAIGRSFRVRGLPHMLDLNIEDFFFWGHPVKGRPGWMPYDPDNDGSTWLGYPDLDADGEAVVHLPPWLCEHYGVDPDGSREFTMSPGKPVDIPPPWESAF